MQDIEINIAEGHHADSKKWRNKKIKWSDFVHRLTQSTQTRESLKTFIGLPKEDQTRIKDVGGYVGGYLRNGRRSKSTVVHRQLLTLDVDFAGSDFFENFRFQFPEAAFIHGTHKHSPTEPRYRLLLPLDRECSPDEYSAVSRYVAGVIGIEMFDNTTFEVNRLMFYPSHPSDVEYYCEEQRGPLMCVDDILASYIDWKDTSLWPTADKRLREIGDAAKKQENPRDKKGIVGAFCRSYTIGEAIETFLPEEYILGVDGRYTYTKGSTSSGLVVYEDEFAYSHHGTDPASGKLCNAFDLVRVHRFGHLDTSDRSTKSYSAMEELARKDEGTRMTLAHEGLEEARLAFGDDIEFEEEEIDWMKKLEVDTKGNYLSTAGNINDIFKNDKYLKRAFMQNEFDGKRYIGKDMPWRKVSRREPMKNVDYSGLRNYIECIYGISSQFKIDDSLALEAERNTFHPIREYLNDLDWDGVPRIDSLLIDYFGVEDTTYSRHVIRKALVAAVNRIMEPGCKYDYVLVLVDQNQGSHKSTFFDVLGREWFSDTFLTVNGKEALEQIQGAWIIEISELSAFKKAEVDAVKQFVSKRIDQFRPAYGRTIETYPRQCIFVGTTNNPDFLKDPTGNRRFWPVDVQKHHATKNISKDLPGEVDQIWAEAVHLYEKKEEVFLAKEVESLAKIEQAKHSEQDERTGLILNFLNKPLPLDWNKLDEHARRAYMASDAEIEGETFIRDTVCIAELWCECLGRNREEMSRYATKEINGIMRGLPGWQMSLSTTSFRIYGTQRFYKRLEI